MRSLALLTKLAATGLIAVASSPLTAQSAAYIGQIDDARTATRQPAPRTAAGPRDSRGNDATIVQRGNDNLASIVQRGGANAVYFRQHGNDNAINAFQQGYANGADNVMDVNQSGDRNRATLGQTGSGNRLELTQTGAKDATISQSGSSTVNVTQLGRGPDSIDVSTDPGASVSITRYPGMLAAQGGR